MDIKRIVELSKAVEQAEKNLEVARADLEAEIKAQGGGKTPIADAAGHMEKAAKVYKPVLNSAPARVMHVMTMKPQRAKDIAKASGVKQDYLPQVLRGLLRSRSIAKVGRGLYKSRLHEYKIGAAK